MLRAERPVASRSGARSQHLARTAGIAGLLIPAGTWRGVQMSKEAADHHIKAAEHHEHAAHHHREAGKSHEAGAHEKAAHHAHTAQGHHEHASHHAREAAKVHVEAHGHK